MSLSRKAGFAILGITLVLGGCRRQPPAEVATPTPAPQTATTAPAPSAQPTPTVNNNAALEAQLRSTLEQMVFFDYDDSSIRGDARQILDAKLPLLRQYTGFTMTIEGHADERGSTEYNLALGTRRAVSVMEYLVGFGLNAQRFRTMSYGEERPLAQGQDESAWSRNRRAQFVVSGGITQER